MPAQLKHGVQGAPGGKRDNAGAKPKAFTLLKRSVEKKTADAEYAFALFAKTMRDTDKPLALRLDCAEWIVNRVLGKPKIAVDLRTSGEIGVTFADYRIGLAQIATGPNSDSNPPGESESADDGETLG